LSSSVHVGQGEERMSETGFLQRLKDKLQKENLWFFILLLLSVEPRYGYELRKLVMEEFGFWSGNVTAYRVLYSLEAAGLVKSRVNERRRYYEITESGRKEIEQAKSFLRGILESAGN
jgi:DNA-binding PadR family transcriptional regulator